MEIDFSTFPSPTDWFSASSISVSDKSVLDPLARASKLGTRTLEVMESLRSAPNMFGLSPSALREFLNGASSQYLGGTFKPKGGKYLRKNCSVHGLQL